MKNVLNKVLAITLLALTFLAPAGPAQADSPHERFVVFGDSLSDPGNAFALLRKVEVPPFDNLIPDAPYARGALHFSNGLTWVEQLSLRVRAVPTAGPALFLPTALSNYAVGSARARASGPVDLSAQVRLFLDHFSGNGPAGALYVIWAGGNDVRDALQALALDPTGAESTFILQQAVFTIRDNIIALYGAGARRFLVPNAPDVGLTPAVRMLDPATQGAAALLSRQFNDGLELMLQGMEAGLGVEIVRLDVFRTLHEVVAAPAAAGLSNVTEPCIRLNVKAGAFCARPGDYLFWDGIHPTAAGHRILARRAHEALNNAPLQALAQ